MLRIARITFALVVMLLVSCTAAASQEATLTPPNMTTLRIFQSLPMQNDEDPMPKGEHLLLASVSYLPDEETARGFFTYLANSQKMADMLKETMVDNDDNSSWFMVRPVEPIHYYKDETRQYFAVSVLKNVAYDTSITLIRDEQKIYIVVAMTVAVDSEIFAAGVMDKIYIDPTREDIPLPDEDDVGLPEVYNED